MGKTERQRLIDDQRAMLDWLEANPGVEVMGGYNYRSIHSKEKFLATAKALGSFEKKIENDYIKLTRAFGTAKIIIEAPRNTVCTKIKEAVWECEPLLSNDEIEALA